jgi:NDP-sugar pyrophosphorylase family protein
MNGDLVTQADLGALLDAHTSTGHAMTVALRPYSVDIPYGVADVEGERLVSIEEKPTLRMWVNAGVYAISSPAVGMVPDGRPSAMTDLVAACLDAGLTVGAHPIEDEWIDVGHRGDLARARSGT